MASRPPLYASSVLLLLAMASVAVSTNSSAPLHSSSHNSLPPCTWCVCKPGPDAILQKTLDYACGHGADCSPIMPNGGACYATVGPGSVRSHCSYAVNSYYHKMNQAGGTCDFCNTATITTTDPSFSGCSFPAIASSSGSTTPVTPVPTTPKTPTTTPVSSPGYGYPPKTSSPPYTTKTPPYSGLTPSTGGLGGGTAGFAPPGMGIYDDSNSGVEKLASRCIALCSVLAVVALHMWK